MPWGWGYGVVSVPIHSVKFSIFYILHNEMFFIFYILLFKILDVVTS